MAARVVPASEARALLASGACANAYVLVNLYDGQDAVPVRLSPGRARQLLSNDFDLKGGDPDVVIDLDAEDASLYLGVDLAAPPVRAG